nr:hypothetical protein [Rubellimicrobium rubrum]
MAAAQHVCLADELVEAARARRKVGEVMAVPSVRVVVLREREGPTVELYNPLDHAVLGKLLRPVRDAPPLDHVRSGAPAG